MKLLHIDASILGQHSTSRQLTAEVVAEWQKNHPNTSVEYLDVVANPIPHFTVDAIAIKGAPQENPTPAQRAENELSEKLVSQFLASDVIVVGAPFYNFSVPTQLKAWIDRLSQPGRTFGYTETGPKGLTSGKTAIVVSTRGGIYSTSEAGQAMEHQESYMKAVFGFFGVTDVRFVRAEGLSKGDAPKAAALAAARADIAKVAR